MSAHPSQRRGFSLSLALIALYLLCPLPMVFAAGSQITITINREAISVKQTVSVNVVTEVEGVSGQVRLVEPPWSDQGWQVLGRSQMTQMQIINGSRSVEVTHTYQLKPTRMGTLTIGPFRGAGTARGLSSNIVKVKVSERAPPRSQEEKRRNNLYAQIKWQVDQREVWLGERIDASLVVYVLNKLRLTDLTVPDIDLQGFWAEEVEPPRRSPFVSIGGKTYSQKVLKRDLLTPLKAGELSLPSFEVNLVVGTHSFFTETQEVLQRVPPLKIKVKPLPPNAPKGFRGPTVGEVKVIASLDRRKIREDEGIQLNIRTRTSGMLANTPAIELPYIDGVKIFPPTERSTNQRLGGKERSVRTQTWLIKPERPGRFTVPAISLPYFDPQRGQYDFAKSRPLTFIVRASPQRSSGDRADQQTRTATPSALSPSRGEKRPSGSSKTAIPDAADRLGIQLYSVMTEPVSVSERQLPQWIWWLIGLIGPLTLLFSEVWGLGARLSESGAAGRAQGRAGKSALRSLEHIEAEPFDYGALDEVINAYLESRFQANFRGLTRDQVCEKLQGEGLSIELIEGYRGLAEAADFARFAPGASPGQGTQVKRLAKAWITLSEDQLRQTPAKDAERRDVSHISLLLSGLLLLTGLVPQTLHAAPLSQRESQSSDSGDHHFWSGDYLAAAKAYRGEVKRSPQRPQLWYNLGTALAHEGHFGEAAYALQRALLLAPDQIMIQQQIDQVNQAIIEDGVRRPGKRRLVLPDELTSSGGLVALITLNLTRMICLSALSFACLIFMGIRRTQRLTPILHSTQLKRLATLRVLVVVLMTISTLSSAIWWLKGQQIGIERGVIVSQRAPLYRGPGAQYEVEVNIAGGVKIELQGAREEWRRVKLSDGREGWLSAQDLRALPLR